VWNRKWSQCSEPLGRHREGIHSCSISLDGSCVVSGSYDKTVCVWTISKEPFTYLDPKLDKSKSPHLKHQLQDHCSNVLTVATCKPRSISEIAKYWPATHHMVPHHAKVSICEVLCVTFKILPKDIQKCIAKKIILVGVQKIITN